jgi:hypothetical protein
VEYILQRVSAEQLQDYQRQENLPGWTMYAANIGMQQLNTSSPITECMFWTPAKYQHSLISDYPPNLESSSVSMSILDKG